MVKPLSSLPARTFRTDWHVGMKAVSRDGMALRLCLQDCRGTSPWALVLRAVSCFLREHPCGGALVYASAAMQTDVQVVKTALRDDHLAYQYASEAVKANPEINKGCWKGSVRLRPCLVVLRDSSAFLILDLLYIYIYISLSLSLFESLSLSLFSLQGSGEPECG